MCARISAPCPQTTATHRPISPTHPPSTEPTTKHLPPNYPFSRTQTFKAASFKRRRQRREYQHTRFITDRETRNSSTGIILNGVCACVRARFLFQCVHARVRGLCQREPRPSQCRKNTHHAMGTSAVDEPTGRGATRALCTQEVHRVAQHARVHPRGFCVANSGRQMK